jgi:hypothetical protein
LEIRKKLPAPGAEEGVGIYAVREVAVRGHNSKTLMIAAPPMVWLLHGCHQPNAGQPPRFHILQAGICQALAAAAFVGARDAAFRRAVQHAPIINTRLVGQQRLDPAPFSSYRLVHWVGKRRHYCRSQ